ncbi:lazarillo protein-like [Tachypleus tridentatus]|uniref:lazarillo protein-like n=1 Tax=Tachypleus tridentatus TaxID=6853 RepID=UPI003FD3B021
MLRYSLILFVLACGLRIANSQTPVISGCPNRTPVEDFDINKFQEKWFVARRNYPPFIPLQIVGGFCQTIELKEQNNSFSLIKTGRILPITDVISVTKDIKFPDKNSPGVMKTNISAISESQIVVLDTDYENYAVLSTCDYIKELNTRLSEIFYILSRKTTLDQPLLEKAQAVVREVAPITILIPIFQSCNQEYLQTA